MVVLLGSFMMFQSFRKSSLLTLHSLQRKWLWSHHHGVSGPTAAQHARPCIESLAVESTAADPQVEAAANCELVSRYCDWSSAFDLLLFISSKTVLVIKKVNEALTGGTAFRRRRLATRARSDNRRLSINRSNLAGSGS
jgi:hypothetical protein